MTPKSLLLDCESEAYRTVPQRHRSMNIFWIILLTLGFAESDFSQRVTVINSLGAAVYERPTFDSPSRVKYPFGESIRVEREVETRERYRVGKRDVLGWMRGLCHGIHRVAHT